MIGDWVRIKGHLDYDKVREIAIDENMKEYISFACSATLFRAYEFEPIPLTEEILKANGFRLIGFHKLDFVRDEGGFASYNRVTHCVSVGCDGSVKKNIGYVHELQHALRLCGLDELADNFKIQ